MAEGAPAVTNRRPTPPTPAEAERRIAHTRAELARTLDALEQKLDARYFVEKGVEMFRDNFAGSETINRSLAAIRANPVPFALIGIATAWLIASNTGVVERVAGDERVGAARRGVAEAASGIGTRAGAIAADVAGRIGIGGDSGGGEAGAAVDEAELRADGWVHQIADRAQDALRSARDAGGAVLNRAGSYAGDGASRVAGQASGAFRRHPLVIGGIGLMAGMLVAALVPLSRTEQEAIGDTREELWQKAQQAGQEAVSQVREAAARAAARAVDAAADAAARSVREELREGTDKASHR
jgi:Protein of unknown function (DUF3618)